MAETAGPSCARKGGLALVAAAFLLCACAVSDPPRRGGADDGTVRFARPDYGVSVRYPATLNARHDFEADYFLDTRWNPDAPERVPGEALLSLTLPESNRVTRGLLRLGASDDPRALAACQAPPESLRTTDNAPQHVVIGGVDFTRIDGGDAAMSHYLHRRRYRALHAGHCIAIDLYVSGTRAEVYDPPPTPPFTVDAAFRRLTSLLDGFSFSP